MPPQSRRSSSSSRRRSNRSTQQRPTASPSSTSTPSGGVTVRSPRATRSERAAQPAIVDYSQDYAFVRRDLYRIAWWSALLLVAMFVMYFVT